MTSQAAFQAYVDDLLTARLRVWQRLGKRIENQRRDWQSLVYLNRELESLGVADAGPLSLTRKRPESENGH